MRGALAPLLLALAVLPAACGIDPRTSELRGSTLRATVVDSDGDGRLEEGPAETLADRTELAPRGRGALRPVARLGHLTDTHVRDEESPARVPFLDRLGPPVTSAFRPQEALSPQVLVAAIRSINFERPEAVVISGDLIDSAQRNEVDQFLAAVAGGEVVPDSGRRGYRGVQAASNPDGLFYRPSVDAPRVPRLLTRASEPFLSPGLRVPWLPALGNHDLLVQGELPPSERTDAIATGNRALLTYDPAIEGLLDRLPSGSGRAATPDLRGVPPEAIDELLAEGVPGRAVTVASDPERRHVRARELVAELRRAARMPAERGAQRLDYAADVGRALRVVVLDTVDRSGGSDGVLLPEQVRFLRRELDRSGDRAVIVVDHYGLHRTRGGEAAQAVLAGDDRVVAELSGDTHRHEIRPVRTRAGGYWRITTASLADWPQQGRMLRLLTAPDGSRALETWAVDHAGGIGLGDLAGTARTLSFLDAQGGRPAGMRATRTDRNARLWLPPRAP